jgi:hypothetical protein
MIILYGMSAYVMCFDLMTVPVKGSPQWREQNPNWTTPPMISPVKIENTSRYWEWDIGNGFVSNVESMVMIGGGFFGFMRTMDFMFILCSGEDRDAKESFKGFKRKVRDKWQEGKTETKEFFVRLRRK